MATLIITRGSHEARQARKAYVGVKNVLIRDVRYAYNYMRGVKYDNIIFTDWCKQSVDWTDHIASGLMYQEENGALVTCLVS